jgi:hypothetical protein
VESDREENIKADDVDWAGGAALSQFASLEWGLSSEPRYQRPDKMENFLEVLDRKEIGPGFVRGGKPGAEGLRLR